MPDIEEREKNIMTGVLSLKSKKIRDIMTHLIDAFMLEADQIVDDALILSVHGYGYSRIPVYEKQRYDENSTTHNIFDPVVVLSVRILSAW